MTYEYCKNTLSGHVKLLRLESMMMSMALMTVTVIVFLLHLLFHTHENYKLRITDTEFEKLDTKRNGIYFKYL
jgi:hypothetical protein